MNDFLLGIFTGAALMAFLIYYFDYLDSRLREGRVPTNAACN